jgi:hypothetical protein
MPALKYKQDFVSSEMDGTPKSFLGRPMSGKSAATTLLEVGRILVGADASAGTVASCRHCGRRRDRYSDSRYPGIFCSEHCEQEFVSSALATFTVEDCIRVHERLERLLLRSEDVLV